MANVLLVDDDPHIARLLARRLESAGFSVHVAEDGRAGLELAAEIMPDLIVTDLQMPRMSGTELAEAVRDHAELGGTPVVLLTARGYFLAPGEQEQLGIVEVVGKPFTARGLVQTIGTILASRPGSTRENREAA